MALHYKADYVYSTKAELGNYFFIGTRKFIFTYPIRIEEGGGSRGIEKTEFFINGDSPIDYLKDLLEKNDMTPEKLEEELKTLHDNFEGDKYHKGKYIQLSDYPIIKVSTPFTGSYLMLSKKKFTTDRVMISNLGKEYKKEIKSFYKN